MVPTNIILATQDHARVLAELRYAFRGAFKTPHETPAAFVERCERWMADRILRHADWWAWLAVRDDDVVGTIWVHRIAKIPNPLAEREALGYITNFFVKPEARGFGIGSVLLRTALAECDSQRCDSVILWPTPKSRALYERHGFKSRDDVFVLKL